MPARGLEWYYDEVVLGARALDAFKVLLHYRGGGGQPVLDIGCGLGTFVVPADSHSMPAVGLEPNLRELALARERATAAGSGPRFVVGTGEALPFEDNSFSALLLHDVLEHVSDWRSVLRECRRVLTPGGVAYVKGPSYSVRFVEPHYRLPWLPLLPRPLARRYLSALGRDVSYLEHLRYRRRGEVLSELASLSFSLSFPRIGKLANPSSINRAWARRLASPFHHGRFLRRMSEIAAENPLQATIEVVAIAPAGSK